MKKTAYMSHLDSDPICPKCKNSGEAFTNLEGKHTPKDGDVAVCAYCCSINVYANKASELRAIGKDELEGLSQDVQNILFETIKIVKQVHEKKTKDAGN